LYYSELFAGSSPNRTVVEGKNNVSQTTTIRELAQSIATALTFASIQQKRHKELHTFPTLRVHPKGIDVILYNTRSDHLMLGSFSWSEQGLYMLWLVLHHNLFSFRQVPKRFEKMTCGFQAYVQSSHSMQKEPKYLVFKNNFEVRDVIITRQCAMLRPSQS